MKEFLIRQLFPTILSLSLSGTLIGIFITAIRPLTGKYFSKKWNYYIWLLVLVRLALPIHFEPDFLNALNFHADLGSVGQPDGDDSALLPSAADSVMADGTKIAANNDIPNISETKNNDGINSRNQPPVKSDDIDLSSANSTDTVLSGADFTNTGFSSANSTGTGFSDADFTDASSSDANFTETVSSAAKFSVTNILTAAAYVWFFGAVTALFMLFLNYHRFRAKIKKDTVRIADCRLTLLESAFCTGLHIPELPAVCESGAVSGPLTIGLWNPMIVLPRGIRCSQSEFQLILHHELVHVARKDLLYKWICQLLLCLHWFNPFLHRIVSQINSDCELSCDEEILANLTDTGKQMYGNILLDAAAQNIGSKRFPYNGNALSTTLLDNKRRLKKRLNGILHYKKASRFRLALSVCTLIAALTLTACSSVQISIRDKAARKAVSDALESAAAVSGSSASDVSESNALESDISESDALESTDSVSDSDEPGLLTRVLTSMASPDAFLNHFSKPKKSGDAWNVYDDDVLLAGNDIQDNWGAYNYSGGIRRIKASGLALYGSSTIVIAYADRDIDVKVTSSFDIVDGKFKIVQIMPDKSVLTLNDTGAKTNQTITMKKGRNVIKMVGQGAKLKALDIDYSDLKGRDFIEIYSSEDEEYAVRLKDSVTAGQPVDKDKIMDYLPYLDGKDASDIFNVLLTSGTPLTSQELIDFFCYSDMKLSGRYLIEAIENRYIQPLEGETLNELMPYLDDNCQTELLMQLPLDEFFDAFADNIYNLNSAQIGECLDYYINAGGRLSYTQFEDISSYLDKNTIKKLDELPDIR